MVKPTGPTSPTTKDIIINLKKASKENKVLIWADIAERLNMPRRIKPAVNVSKLDKYGNKDDFIIIPGKLLAAGEITKPMTISALKASESAVKKIEDAKGKFLNIPDFVKQNPTGKNVKIIY